jgi:hypothetical protein
MQVNPPPFPHYGQIFFKDEMLDRLLRATQIDRSLFKFSNTGCTSATEKRDNSSFRTEATSPANAFANPISFFNCIREK